MTPEGKRIFIVVKTYPTISKEYAELVCTAGVLEDGSWIRLYPVPFRKLDIEQKYPKYTWIDVEAVRNTADFRPETYRPNLATLSVGARASKIDWDERRRIIFNNKKIFTNIQEMNDKAKSEDMSLAVFKPTKLLDFVVEPTERDWNPDKLTILRNLSQQMSLFQTPEEIEQEFRVVPKVPYKFSYRFEDNSGNQYEPMIEDWEIGMLYFNCLKRAKGDEKAATAKVREKYYDEFAKSDLHFFMGTIKAYHKVSQNPFIIVGVFHPPMSRYEQHTLFA
jgi:hypothetical protein